MEFEINNGFLIKYIGNDPVVVIPNGVTEIDSYAFCGRDDILEITLPESGVKVWSYAFAGCPNLGSTELSNKTFKLYTLISKRPLEAISYLEDADISKECILGMSIKRLQPKR